MVLALHLVAARHHGVRGTRRRRGRRAGLGRVVGQLGAGRLGRYRARFHADGDPGTWLLLLPPPPPEHAKDDRRYDEHAHADPDPDADTRPGRQAVG